MSYKLNPFAHFVESHLLPVPQFAVFNRLTGELVELAPTALSLLMAVKQGSAISFDESQLEQLAKYNSEIVTLIQQQFLTPNDDVTLAAFAGYYVARPLQSPAITYRTETGTTMLVRLSMTERVFSPAADQVAPVIEEEMPPVAARIFSVADGRKTLAEIASAETPGQNGVDAPSFCEAMDFLTKPERQLVKLTLENEGFDHPNEPVNTVPRNLYHAPRSGAPARGADSKALTDFHQEGIRNAEWEFDVVESTVNHAFRFPNEALGGMDYGSRFCVSTLKQEIVARLGNSDCLNILEVGGGTGSFARAFLNQARSMNTSVRYHILDLAPALIESQRQLLSNASPPVEHFQQDATAFDLPGREFDLIIANEVIADFPTAEVQRNSSPQADAGHQWIGEGGQYVEKYSLSVDDAPQQFLVNAGVFKFVERAWSHLAPGGALVVSEYGGEHKYPAEAFHLNHAEFSIHFGHVMDCARKVGFQSRLLTLGDFLGVNEDVSMLNGNNEHIQCLNHVFKKYGASLEFRLISEREFKERFQELATRIDLCGYSFRPLAGGFHYGPNIRDFMVLIMRKPVA